MNIQVVGHRHWPKPSTPRGPAPHIGGLMRKKGNRRQAKKGLCHPLRMTGTIYTRVFCLNNGTNESSMDSDDVRRRNET
jgi:hypothetical protein